MNRWGFEWWGGGGGGGGDGGGGGGRGRLSDVVSYKCCDCVIELRDP